MLSNHTNDKDNVWNTKLYLFIASMATKVKILTVLNILNTRDSNCKQLKKIPKSPKFELDGLGGKLKANVSILLANITKIYQTIRIC